MPSKKLEYVLPTPLLLHHEAKLVVGQVTKITVQQDQIDVEFSLPEIKEAGALKDRVDEAYQSIQYKLITGLSLVLC